MISFLIEENDGIRKFFAGDDSYTPISEYRYLHDRPLIRPSFLTQVEDIAGLVSRKIVDNNLKSGVPTEKLTKLAIVVGQNLDGPLTDDKIETILKALRDIYNICTDLNKKLK